MGALRVRHVLTHSVPTLRSSGLPDLCWRGEAEAYAADVALVADPTGVHLDRDRPPDGPRCLDCLVVGCGQVCKCSWYAVCGDQAGRLVFGELGPPGSPSSRDRSEEHTSELQSLMCISYAVFCLKKKTK